MITVITCTGNRKQAFNLSQLWMSKQTIKPDQWIVVDDGNELQEITQPMTYIKRLKGVKEPEHTLLLNLKESLKYVLGDKIIIWEDDEYYSENYIEVMSNKLDKYDLVGIGENKYYHLPSHKYFRHINQNNSSLAQTAFNKRVIDNLQNLFNGNQYIDMRLWKLQRLNKHIFFDNDKSLYCGIKGLQGRKGIGWAHNSWNPRLLTDKNHTLLKQWIPKDYQIYLDL